MNNKTLGIIIILFGGLVLYSNQDGSWIVSAIAVGLGSGLFFFPSKEDKNDIEN